MNLYVFQMFPEHDIEAVHDFELLPSRRPKVLVQTAGHVSGAAYYYQRKDVVPDPWDKKTVSRTFICIFVTYEGKIQIMFEFLVRLDWNKQSQGPLYSIPAFVV